MADKIQEPEVLMAGAGTIAAKKSFPLLTGRLKLYHGTDPEIVGKIKKEGLRSKFTGAKGSITEVLKDHPFSTEKIYKESLGKVYATPSKMIARSYAETRKKMKKTGQSFSDVKTHHSGDISKSMLNPFRNKGIVRMSVPFDKVVGNPEAKLSNLTEFQRMNLNKVMPAIKGDVAPKYIKGNKGYYKSVLKELPGYIKKHPGRFGGGLALLAGGALLAGKGVHGMTKEASSADMVKMTSEKPGALFRAIVLEN